MRCLALAVVCALAACGFLGTSDPPAAPPADGLGPFPHPLPLQVCDGTARWDIRTVGPAGFCVPRDSTPAACAGPRECGPREQCLCGRCTVPLCATDGDCPPGEVCHADSARCAPPCSESVPCPARSVCRTGACIPTCVSATDCARGEHCNAGGLCVALPCAGDGACGADRCDAQRVAADLREPAVIPAGDGTPGAWLYLEVDHLAIWRAVSTDGVVFRVDPPHPVLALPGQRVGAPAVTRMPDGTYLLAAARGQDQAIVLATSPDGLRFDTPTDVLTPSELWEGTEMASPGIAWFAHRLVLSFTSRDGIGMATVQIVHGDTFVVTRVRDDISGSARVLDPTRVSDPIFWRAVDRVEGPDLVPVHTAAGRELLRMYFSARGAEASATVTDGMLREPPVHWSIGVASADASLVFHPSPFDPLLTRVEGVGDTRDAREPSAVALGDRWLLVVRGETLAGADEGLFSAGP